MSTFHFKQFDVVNDASVMKVGTDGVLLGAAATLLDSDRHVLDAGTGTGTIALMLAQRYYSLVFSDPGAAFVPPVSGSASAVPSLCPAALPRIAGIDIDGCAAGEAAFNFAASPWAEALTAEHCALASFAPPAPLDLIVSNPPYFEKSLLPPLDGRRMARHTGGEAMSFADLALFAQGHLSDSGRLSVILPSDQELQTIRFAASCGLYPFRILRIRTTPRKPLSRFIAEFSRSRLHPISELSCSPLQPISELSCSPLRPSSDLTPPARLSQLVEEMLTIQDPAMYPGHRNGYTPDYLRLTGDFYLD